MVYKFKPLELTFEFEQRWYDLGETIDIQLNLKPNGEVDVREARVDLMCEEIHTRNQSGVSMGSGGASSIAGGSRLSIQLRMVYSPVYSERLYSKPELLLGN